jgi:hypothetical protein
MIKTMRSVLWLALFLAASQTQLFSSEKKLERDYWWCSIPYKWCEWGVEHSCYNEDDGDDEDACYVSCNDVCAQCYLEAYSPKFPGKHSRMPESYRTGVA